MGKERTAFSLMISPLLQLAESQKPCVEIFAWDPSIQISLSWFASLCVGYTAPYPPHQACIRKEESLESILQCGKLWQQRFLFVLFKR